MNMQALEPGTAAYDANAETEALAEGEFTLIKKTKRSQRYKK